MKKYLFVLFACAMLLIGCDEEETPRVAGTYMAGQMNSSDWYGDIEINYIKDEGKLILLGATDEANQETLSLIVDWFWEPKLMGNFNGEGVSYYTTIGGDVVDKEYVSNNYSVYLEFDETTMIMSGTFRALLVNKKDSTDKIEFKNSGVRGKVMVQ